MTGLLRSRHHQRVAWALVLLGASLALSFFTVYDQVFHRTGVEFLLSDQFERHQDVLAGRAIDPWQYRVFAEIVVEVALRVARFLGLNGPVLEAFFAVRAMQNTLIFLAAALYWLKLGIGRLHTLLGMSVLAWGLSYSGYASGLAFSTYFDILFYLLAGTLILSGLEGWVLAVSAVAAINQETSGLIPFLLASTAVVRERGRWLVDRRKVVLAAGSAALYFAGYGFLRWFIGPRPLMRPHGETLGLDLLGFNLTTFYSYFSLIAAFGILPLLAIASWNRWPGVLRRFFWVIVPVWLAVHLVAGAIAEARILMVPYVMVVLPAALLAVQRETESSETKTKLR